MKDLDLRATKCYNCDQNDLLILGHNQILQNPDWQKEEQEVCDNIDARIGEIERPFIDAVSTWNSDIPEIGNGSTCEGTTEKCFDAICNDKRSDNVGCCACRARDADTQVL